MVKFLICRRKRTHSPSSGQILPEKDQCSQPLNIEGLIIQYVQDRGED